MKLYGNADITSIAYDSRRAAAGSLFVCLRGAVTDGHKYAPKAYETGCRAFLCEEALDLPADVEQYLVPDTRIALAEASARFFGYPAKKLRLIGVTGTKGKTSVSTFICEALNRSGHKAALIGTNGIFIGGERTPTVNSTPESYELHRAFAEMAEGGMEFAVMEVSSQAYKMSRVYGLQFEVGVFTNLSRDHIGENEHPDFEDYRECKARMFQNSKLSVLNSDDAGFGYMAERSGRFVTYGVETAADYTASNVTFWRDDNSLGVAFKCVTPENGPEHELNVTVKTPGMFSVYNALAAIAVCRSLDIGYTPVLQTLSTVCVKGRFEIIDALPYATFIIDYAHNELSLRSALETIRFYSPKRLVCLFGSIGGRSAMRREGLGAAAGELADFCIITSDNPDKENPLDIISDIEKGIRTNETPCPYVIMPDRTEAVTYAVASAAEGDVVLLAGKGHEDYQIIRGERVPFSERAIIEKTAEKVLNGTMTVNRRVNI